MPLLQGKVAIITGAAAGIGAETARLFAAEGARLAALDMDRAGALAVAAAIEKSGGSAIASEVDVRERAQIQRAVEQTIARYGRLDILINNAGIFPRQSFLEMTEGQWDDMQSVNLKSAFHSAQLALPQMVAQQSGKIVNISSVTFHMGMKNMTHYIASKGGLIGLTRALAREFGDYNIYINCVTPGAIKTESEARFVTPQQAEEFLARQCLRRRLMPLDVARVCLFLASELSDGMTGQTLNVDAGWVMH